MSRGNIYIFDILRKNSLFHIMFVTITESNNESNISGIVFTDDSSVAFSLLLFLKTQFLSSLLAESQIFNGVISFVFFLRLDARL